MKREYEQSCCLTKLQAEANRYPVPSLMEMATTLGVLATIPPLRKTPKIVVAAVNLGARIDDYHDKGTERSNGQGISPETFVSRGEDKIPDGVNLSLLIRCWQAWDNLVGTVGLSILRPEEKDRIVRNSHIFVDNVAAVENHALSIPKKDWTLALAGRYRRAGCLGWAVYFTSLAPESESNLIRFPAEEGIRGPKNYYLHFLNESGETAEWIRRLYYGASTYQLVCDWTGKKVNQQRSIPGYGSIGDVPPEERYQQLLNRYGSSPDFLKLQV
jgi:hypothetical protein